jgi:ATP-dependent phosphofructokinase / diphosphate-dependent phosphofructokinase
VTQHRTLGILVGGGPAPGINSVIGAATIRAALAGHTVLGIEDGFEWLMQGDATHVRPLTAEGVSRIHFRGGSHLGISRANPTTSAEHLGRTVQTLLGLDISQLITIGGDDTAYSAMTLAERAGGRIQVVHVPKSIDNDLDLPHTVDTFGYQTARHVGVELLKNLMVDARTTSRWYFVIAMGRKAGHLALGIGKAGGATITLIPEEFRRRPIELRRLADTLVGSILRRRADGRKDGVAVIAEGVGEFLDPKSLEHFGELERDAHGHVRLAELNLGEILKHEVQARLKSLGLKITIVEKNIGYELRCADPIPFDMEYSRDLGYCAAEYLIEGGSNAMVSVQAGHFVPVPFQSLRDAATGRARIRMVKIESTRYAIARRYMIRLRHEDFDNPQELAKLAAQAGITAAEFRRQFEYLTADEPPPRVLSDPEETASSEAITGA